jgi:N-acetyl-alpha-D-glucosaminyl L-malate synthase BshA
MLLRLQFALGRDCIFGQNIFMNIGIVLYPTYGGSGVVATELGKALAGQGHRIHFISYSLPARLGSLRENIFYHEVRPSDYPLFEYTPYELVLTSKIVDVAEHEKLDILHVHYAIPHASAAFMAQKILISKGIQLPFITTLHGTDITLVGKDPSFEPVISFAINRSNAVTAVSEDLKRDTYAHFAVERNIHVIPNFVCPERHRKSADEHLRKYYAPNGEPIVVHISNFRPVKRVADAVAAFAGLLKHQPAKMIFVGDGPDRYHAESLCRELGTCAHTSFLGNTKDVEDILAISDVFFLPSETESFGLAALEAMISRVPVVATHTGGIPEVVENGVSGYLSEVGNVEGFTANLIKILRDDATLQGFKERAYTRALKFDIANILPLYLKLYEDISQSDKVEQSLYL